METIGSDGLSPAVEKMLGSAIIGRFQITDARLSMDSDGISLEFHVRPTEETEIQLMSGEDLVDLKGYLSIHSDADDSTETKSSRKELEMLGALRYHEGNEYSPHWYAIEVVLPEGQFNALYDAVTRGCIPSYATVTRKRWRDMKLSVSDVLVWDSKVTPVVVVDSADFTVPLMVPLNADSDGQHPLANAMPATRLQIDRLGQQLDSYKNEIVKMLTRIFWAVVVVGGLIVLVK